MPKVPRGKVIGAGDAPEGRWNLPLPRVPRVRKKLQNKRGGVRRGDQPQPHDWSKHWPFERATGLTLEILNQREPKRDLTQDVGEALI